MLCLNEHVLFYALFCLNEHMSSSLFSYRLPSGWVKAPILTQVQEFVSRPALRQTVTTTYWNTETVTAVKLQSSLTTPSLVVFNKLNTQPPTPALPQHMHAFTHAHTYTHTHPHPPSMDAYTHTYTLKHVHMCTHTHTQNTHTQTGMQAHTHTHTRSLTDRHVQITKTKLLPISHMDTCTSWK